MGGQLTAPIAIMAVLMPGSNVAEMAIRNNNTGNAIIISVNLIMRVSTHLPK